MLIILMRIISGQVGAVELREQSGWKLSKESSDRTTSPRVTLGRQFAGAGESCREKMVTLWVYLAVMAYPILSNLILNYDYLC